MSAKLKFTLMHKLGGGYLLMAGSLLICAIVGFSAANSLSSTLNYITQNAWDAADGAMEGTIEIEAELLVLDRILLNVVSIDEGEKLINQASERAEEALGRMKASGLMEVNDVAELEKILAAFRHHRDLIITQYGQLNIDRKNAAENMSQFDALLSALEETIEETLENSELKYMTATQLMPLWDVANATMETRLGLLIRSQAFNLLLSANDAGKQQNVMTAGLEQARDRIDMIFNSSYGSEKTTDGKTYQQAITEMLSEHEKIYDKTVGSHFEFVESKARLDQTITKLLHQIAEIEEIGDSKVENIVDDVADTISYSKNSIVISAILGLIIVIICFVYSMRAIVKPIKDIAQRLTRISEEGGDLTQRLDIRSHDEIAKLSIGFNSFIEKIAQIIETVMQSSSHVSGSARELSTITSLASDGASRQSRENSAVATAVEEMTASAEQIAESAASAAQETSKADASAHQGKSIVTQSIGGIQTLSNEVSAAAVVINNLEQEADSIGSVLDVIRGIAEQTNLLALNAAIEAARAGEQGRGFAVVADEVRTLASRTQQSTEEIQAMIESLQSGTKKAVSEMDKSCKQAENTVQMAQEAGQSLDEIVSAVSQINTTNNQIAHAASEQKKTASEVSLNVMAIQSVSEQTAENSLQAQSTSAEMAQQAELLQGLMQQFNT